MVAAQVGQVEAHRQVSERRRQLAQFVQQLGDLGVLRQARSRLVEHLRTAVEFGQREQGAARRFGHVGQHAPQFGHVLRLQQAEEFLLAPRHQPGARGQRVEDADMTDVDPRRRHLGQAQHFGEQTQDLDVGLDTGMAVKFGTELQRLARGSQRRRQGVQHAAAVAQARYTLAIEKVCVDAGDLRRHVGAHTHRASGQLIDQRERAQRKVAPRAGGQRVQIFQQRRHHQLVAAHAEGIEQPAPERFELVSIGRQGVLDVIGQYPAHEQVRGR